jgi:hypothetical protein
MLLFTSLFTAGSFAAPPGGGAGSIALVNGGFETGDFSGWTIVSGSGWTIVSGSGWTIVSGSGWTAATAATTGNSDPRSGTYYARHGGVAAGVAIRQHFDLLASGFTEGEIDAGTLTLNFSAWIGGEDGVNDGGRPRVNYLDAALALVDSTETANSIPPAGTYPQVSINETIPATTRHLQLDLILRGNAGGSTLPFADDGAASIEYPA